MKIKDFLKTFWGGALVTILILAISYFVWSFVKSGGITFAFLGPDEAKSGEIKEFHFILNNNSRVSLQEVEAEINLPEGVIAVDNPDQKTISYSLGEMAPHGSEDKIIKLLITGEPKTIKNIEAILRYRPRTLSSVFEKKEIKTVLISGSSFRLEIVTLNQVFSEQIFPLEINWENLSSYTFDNVEIRAEWPSGFIFQESNPEIFSESSEYNRWTLGELSPASHGKIIVKGFTTGQPGETKRTILHLGMVKDNVFLPLAKTEGYTTLIRNPLLISSLVNSEIIHNADLGETLNFVVDYQNNYSATLRNLTVKVVFSGDVFDFSTLRAPNGAFSSRLKTLTWEGTKVPQLYALNPGERGNLLFSIKLKKDWPMASQAQKNIVLETHTTMESSNIPEQLEVSELPRAAALNTIKLNSDSKVVISSYFRDASSQIANTGRLPLKAGEPTDFTIHWKIINNFNALKNITVKTTLPLWVEFTGQIAGDYGQNPPHYDSAIREVSWTIPSVSAGSGVLTKASEAVFQIKVTPSSSHVNQEIDLLGNTIFTAIDAFTGKDISLSYPVVGSTQLTDKTVFAGDGIVRP
jgi:hypothetical protein